MKKDKVLVELTRGPKHWLRLLPEAGDMIAARSCESLMRDLDALESRRAALLAELRDENEGALQVARRNWSDEEIAAAVEGWTAPKFWAEVMEANDENIE